MAQTERQMSRPTSRRTLGSPRPLSLPITRRIARQASALRMADGAATQPVRVIQPRMRPTLPAEQIAAERGQQLAVTRSARAKRHADWLAALESEWREALDGIQYRVVQLRYLSPVADGSWRACERVGVLTGFGIDAVGRRTACLMTAPTAVRRGEHPERSAIPLMWITQVAPA